MFQVVHPVEIPGLSGCDGFDGRDDIFLMLEILYQKRYCWTRGIGTYFITHTVLAAAIARCVSSTRGPRAILIIVNLAHQFPHYWVSSPHHLHDNARGWRSAVHCIAGCRAPWHWTERCLCTRLTARLDIIDRLYFPILNPCCINLRQGPLSTAKLQYHSRFDGLVISYSMQCPCDIAVPSTPSYLLQPSKCHDEP